MSTSVHFFDADRPDDDDVFPVNVYAEVIPRVGDSVRYHVDDPSHKFEGKEPGAILGTVARVEVEYRRMKNGTAVMASVYLNNYTAVPPKGWRQVRK